MILLLAVLAACASKPAPTGAPPPPPIAEEAAVAPDDFAPTYGAPVELEGLYVVDPIAAGRKAQPGWLRLDDGRAWILSYSPVPALFAFVDKRVVVRGRPYENSPHVASIGATHFELESMVLAPGEIPREPVPDVLPAPPHARTVEALAARANLWVQAVGVLLAVEPGDVGAVGRFRFEDGAELPITFLPGPAERWADRVGEPVTLVAVVAPDGGALSAHAVCAGFVERCGME